MPSKHTQTIQIEGDSPIIPIVRAVAAIRDENPIHLSPLGDIIDVEALEAFTALSSSDSVDGGTVTFTYEGVSVTVDLDGVTTLAWE